MSVKYYHLREYSQFGVKLTDLSQNDLLSEIIFNGIDWFNLWRLEISNQSLFTEKAPETDEPQQHGLGV